ncbi:CPBP family intramembrane glutamic endopeptidase [Halalkalicoccus ordinarius]|uniref:CPBP family intramembrane glutamic endopeptidase n=1 Tax=Halalkalicoccus ordinarius TaxID=3116651 RepID=UPI00300F6486
MAEWATFVGLTGVVCVLLLALAHLSRTVVEPRDERTETPDPEITPGALLANVALSQGLFAAVLLAAAWYTEIPPAALGIGTDAGTSGLGAVGIGLGLGLALYLASEAGGALADRLGFTYDERLRGLLAPRSAGGWAVLLGLVLPVIAAFEEFLFRAALIGAVAAGYGVSPWLLAIVSSVLFALGHGAQGRTGVVVTGLLGFVLAAAFVLTGSLLVVVIAHYVVNALEFVVHEGLGIDWAG